MGHQILRLLAGQIRKRAGLVLADVAARHVAHAAIFPQDIQTHKGFPAVGAAHQLGQQPVDIGAVDDRYPPLTTQTRAVPQLVVHTHIAGGRAALRVQIGLVLQPFACLIVLLQNGAVEGDHALHRCGIIGGEIRIAGAEADGGNVLRVRDAVLIAGDVQLHAHRHRRQHQHHGRRLQPPALVEDAELLLQQHLGGEEADHAHDQLADQQAGEAAVDKGGIAQEQTQPQTAAQTDTPPGDGAQPPEGHSVAGRLAGALFIQPPHQRQQCDAHRGVDDTGGEGGGRQLDALIALGADGLAELHFDGLGAAVGHGIPDPTHRRQPGDELRNVAAAVAEVKHLRHRAYHRVQKEGDDVHRAVEHRHRQQPSRDHGAQGAEREEEQRHQLRQQQPRAQRRPVHVGEAGAAQSGQQEDQHVPRRQRSQRREDVGEKCLCPCHRQGVHQSHGAAGHQVRPHRHGRKAAEQQGHDHGGGYGLDDDVVLPQLQHGHDALRHAVALPARRQYLHGQDHHPHGHIQKQQRPVALYIAAQQRGVTEGCLSRHNPHLPVRK